MKVLGTASVSGNTVTLQLQGDGRKGESLNGTATFDVADESSSFQDGAQYNIEINKRRG